MKKIKFIIPILFVFSFLFVSCPDENEAENLPNTDFYISPEKNSYSINDNLLITFSSIPNFSTFDKYTFEIYAKKYDTTQNEYVLTDKVDFIDITTEEIKKSVNFEYDEKNVGDSSKVLKTFFAKITEQGKFVFWIHGDGWSFNAKGGCSVYGVNLMSLRLS